MHFLHGWDIKIIDILPICRIMEIGGDKMRWINEFISSLEQWDEETPGKRLSLNDLASYLCLTLGGNLDFDKKTGLSDLKARMIHLVEEEAIQEQFIVDSLIHYTTDYLRRPVENRGEHIVDEERVIDLYQKEGKEVPKTAYERLGRLKSSEDIIDSIKVLSTWKQIVANNFSLISRRMLFNEEMRERFEDHKQFIESLPEEDKNKTFGELRKKYKNE